MSATATKQKTRIHVRWVSCRADISHMLRVENQSFPTPWTEDDFLNCLRQRNCIGMVAEHDDHIVGYMLYQLDKKQLTLLNLAVSPDFRRTGVGGQLVEKLVRKLATHHRERIVATVSERNLPAQLMFRQLGWIATRVLRHHYDENDDSAIEMTYFADPERWE